MTASTTQARSTPRYWRNIGCFCVMLAAAVGLVIPALWVGRVASSGIRPMRVPVTASPADYGMANFERIRLTTADGIALWGWYIPPQNGAVILLGHGHAANRAQMLPYAQVLSRHGYGALLMDWRAHGDSGGEVTTLGDAEQQDVDAAVAYLRARSEVQHIGALGLSMGAATLTMGTARHPEIEAAVLEAAYASLEDVARQRMGGLPLIAPIAIAWGEQQTGSRVESVRPVDEICAISPRPVMLIYGTNDTNIPPNSRDVMWTAACDPKELWRVEGGVHTNTFYLLPDEYERRVIAFFDAALLGD